MRRVLLLLFWLVELPVAVVGALLLAFWVWSGTDESLASALAQARRFLPAGHSLVAENVRGSLRQGGHIGLLRWEWDGLTVQARDITLAWQPRSLLDRRLQLDTLDMAELSVDDRRPAAAGGPPEQLLLPFAVDVSFRIGVARWAGPPALEARTLEGRYQYEQQQHALELQRAQVAAGQYQAQAKLQAIAPLRLDLQMQGRVQAPLGERQIELDASATLRGPLAGADPVLEMQAQLQPRHVGTGAAVNARLTARIRPWAQQPIQQAQAVFSQLNLASLWPGTPLTRLTGNARVEPRGDNWQGQVHVVNGLAGPWDRGRLPIDSARALVEYVGGRWNIQSAHLEGAGGQIQAQGRLEDAAQVTALSGWQVQATVQDIDPAALHSALAPVRLSGTMNVSAVRETLQFDTVLRPAAQQGANSPIRGLRLQRLTARGRWVGGWLELQELDLQSDDARLQGRIDLQPATRAMRGALQLAWPGAQARADGNMAATEGAAELSVQVADAGRALRWLAALPQAPAVLAGYSVQGTAEWTLNWQGGWQALLDGRGPEPVLQSSLRAARLQVMVPDATAGQALQLRAVQAELSGRLGALALKADGEMRSGTNTLAVQMQAQGGRQAGGNWQAALSALRLQAADTLRPGPWLLTLGQPVTLDWMPSAQGGALTSSAGEAALRGPAPGVATLAWEPLRWSVGARSELRSRGQLRGIGLGWLELLANTQLADLRLSGDMIFDADWDLEAADSLKLRAALVRRSGDLRVQTNNLGAGSGRSTAAASAAAGSAGNTISAGVRDARIDIRADGDQLRAALRWDSERTGEAQADFSTRISRGVQGWGWPLDSPLQATVKARLPQVGAWSMLAPPGWRMRGTLDANLALTGTRAAPQWSGTLNADDLGLRSVVDGVEFANGRLRATMRGQRLDIQEFSLQGAGGAAGGSLRATGFAEWLPAGTAADPALMRVRLLLDATASGLRVSARADRRLAVSGTLQARLDNARLDLSGALKADQALFILPDETAPSLGADVMVRGASTTGALPDTEPAPPPRASTTAAARLATNLSVALDFGPDFRLQGRGITTRLAGTLQLRSTMLANVAPRLTGEVRTVLGSYRAYGQQLDIEYGVLRFTGSYDNPSLDILALRPNLSQRVGVQITGTALSPRVRLYSVPELPEAQKLAWLVLGRSGANGGAEAAVLQQAAMALLGGSDGGLSGGLASALGLDELSFSGATSSANGGATGATVTLGKRISRNFYVAYERSLAGTLGTFSIFYDLSSRFTLRARTGEQSALDLIFTVNYD